MIKYPPKLYLHKIICNLSNCNLCFPIYYYKPIHWLLSKKFPNSCSDRPEQLSGEDDHDHDDGDHDDDLDHDHDHGDDDDDDEKKGSAVSRLAAKCSLCHSVKTASTQPSSSLSSSSLSSSSLPASSLSSSSSPSSSLP